MQQHSLLYEGCNMRPQKTAQLGASWQVLLGK